MEHYDVHVRGVSSKGKGWVRQYGSTWTVIGTNGPNVLILSPPTAPTHVRAVRAVGDPNFAAGVFNHYLPRYTRP